MSQCWHVIPLILESRPKTKFKHFILSVLSHVGGTESRGPVLSLFAWNLTCLTPWCAKRKESFARTCNDVATKKTKYGLLIGVYFDSKCGDSRGWVWVCVEWGAGEVGVWKAVLFGARYLHFGIPMSGVKKARLLVETPLLRQTQPAKSPRAHFQKLLLMWACVNHPTDSSPLISFSCPYEIVMH